MGNASFEFLGFGLLVAIVYQFFQVVLWRQLVLLAASGCFLFTFAHGYRAVLPFFGFLLFGYLALQMTNRAPAAGFFLVVTTTILFFVWVKKYSFIPVSLFLPFPYLTIGLSYILFRLLHLLLDTRSGLLDEPINPLQYLTYTINFTTLLSGPIQKYSDFKSKVELRGSAVPSVPVIGAALERIVRGMFKANVLALILSDMQTSSVSQLARSTTHGHSAILSGIAALAIYPFFLYCNFSGYIDVVIGIARLFGHTLPENFDRPFSADSFIGFWSRWHITLSEWLKSYVYNPLLMALMRKYPTPGMEPVWAVLSFFITFFLIGVWHGQTSAFLFFGFLQGLGISANKLYQIVLTKRLGGKSYRSVSSNPIYVTISRGLTFTWFTFTMLWFWSNWTQIRSLFSAAGWQNMIAIWIAIWVGASLIFAVWEVLRSFFLSIRWNGSPVLASRYWRTAWNTGLLVITVAVIVLSNQAAPDMVYKAF